MSDMYKNKKQKKNKAHWISRLELLGMVTCSSSLRATGGLPVR